MTVRCKRICLLLVFFTAIVSLIFGVFGLKVNKGFAAGSFRIYEKMSGDISVGQTVSALPSAKDGFSVGFAYQNLISDYTPFITNGNFTANLAIIHTEKGDVYEYSAVLGSDFKRDYEDTPYSIFTEISAFATVTFHADGSVKYYRNGKLALTYRSDLLITGSYTLGSQVASFLSDVAESGLTFGTTTSNISIGTPAMSDLVITDPLTDLQADELYQLYLSNELFADEPEIPDEPELTECEKNGHSYEVSRTDATCTENQSVTYVCRICGDTYTELIEGTKTGHLREEESAVWNWEIGDETVASVTVFCSQCGQTDTLQAEVTYTMELSDCFTNGYILYHATAEIDETVFTDSYTVILQNSHHLTYCQESPATCTESGIAAHYRCSACGSFFADEKGCTRIPSPPTIDPLGHTWSAWITSLAPTETEFGTESRTCHTCGENEYRTLEPLGSDFTVDSFRNAVLAVCFAVTREEKLEAIRTALACYGALSEESKRETAESYECLVSEIKSYNETAELANAEYSSAADTAFAILASGLAAFTNLTVAGFALRSLYGRRS